MTFGADKKGALSATESYACELNGLVQIFLKLWFPDTPPADEFEMQFNVIRVDRFDSNGTVEFGPPQCDPSRLTGIRQERDQTSDVERPAILSRFVW